jgi:hypothetical protein
VARVFVRVTSTVQRPLIAHQLLAQGQACGRFDMARRASMPLAWPFSPDASDLLDSEPVVNWGYG